MKSKTIKTKRRRTRALRYISLFSGVECASLAVRPLGWKPVCFAEIEPFPCAVLAHRFPGIPNVGDVTRHDWSQYREKCDVVIGGSPCQAFSVVGRRQSLSDARGNLTLSYVEAVNAIDPKFILWENVPGVLSVKDNIFGCFLAALAGCRSPVIPPRGRKWPNAGMVAGPRRVLAWRVLDAQYFGVPQRRRRVFLVGCPRTSGFDPGEILFEREGLRGDSPQGGKTGQDIAGTFTSRPRSGGWSHDADLAAAGYMQIAKCPASKNHGGHWDGGEVHPSLSQSHNTGGIGMSDQELFSQRGAGLVAKCLTSSNQRIDLETETLVAGTLCGSGAGTERPAGQANEPNFLVAHTLRGEGFDASEDGTGRGTPLVTYTVSTAHTKSNGHGISKNLAYTLDRAQGQAVAYAIQENVINRSDAVGAGGKGWFREESPTLGGNGNTHAVAFTQNQAGDVLAGRVAPAIGTNANATGRNTAKVMATGVRRLTPRECERLQGMPDDHTLVPYRGKPAADGPRYKAIGNGMAVPCIGWILRRIHNQFQGGVA